MTKKSGTEQQEKLQVEEKVEELFARVNYELTRKYKIIAPDAHYNQVGVFFFNERIFTNKTNVFFTKFHTYVK